MILNLESPNFGFDSAYEHVRKIKSFWKQEKNFAWTCASFWCLWSVFNFILKMYKIPNVVLTKPLFYKVQVLHAKWRRGTVVPDF